MSLYSEIAEVEHLLAQARLKLDEIIGNGAYGKYPQIRDIRDVMRVSSNLLGDISRREMETDPVARSGERRLQQKTDDS